MRKIDSIVLFMGFFLLLGLGLAADEPNKPKEVTCPQITVEMPPVPVEVIPTEDDEYREPDGTLMNDQVH